MLPAGSFMMGSPASEEGRHDDEGLVHRVTIPAAFAVGKHEVTFAEWDACRAGGGCRHHPYDQGWGRGDRPVINVSLDDAQAYVRWLSQETGERYRLLSEAEWEVRGSGGLADAVRVGRRDRPQPRQLRRVRQPLGTRVNGAGGFLCTKRVRSPGPARQCVGVGRGLLERQLRGRAGGRDGVDPREL